MSEQMQPHSRKLCHVKVHDFMMRLIKINQYSLMFPPFLPDQMLLGDDVVDIADYAIPWHWQYTMRLHF